MLKSFRIPLYFLAAYLIFMGVGSCIVFVIIPSTCDADSKKLIASDNWRIEASNVDATMIWQLRQQRKHDENVVVSQQFKELATSGNEILYLRMATGSYCDSDREIVAFNLETGQESWRIKAPLSINHLIGIDDGFLVTTAGGQVIKIDFSGDMLWENHDFISRSIAPAYQVESDIYIPSSKKLFKVSNATGRITEEYNLGQIYGVWDGIAVAAIDDSTFRLIDLDTDTALIDLTFDWQVDNSVIPRQTTFLYQDTLIIMKHKAIAAYDIHSGAFLWEIEEDFYNNPILLDDNLILINENNTLKIYNPMSGEQTGYVELSAAEMPDITDIQLAGSNGVVVITIRNSHELIALRIANPSLN